MGVGNTMKDVESLESEIINTQKQISDREWDNEPCEHLKKHLRSLIDLQLKGDVWFPLF